MLAAVLALSVVASADELAIGATFARWKQLARDTKSLVAEFTITVQDPFKNRRSVSNWKLTLLRSDSDVLVKLVGLSHGEKDEIEFIHKAGTIHILRREAKVSGSYRPDSVLEQATRFFQPVIMTLADGKFDDTFQWKVVERDSYFTYLELKPKKVGAARSPCLVAVVHRANDDLPLGMPRQTRTSDTLQRKTLDLLKWAWNGKNPPKVADFDVPTEKDGWTVSDLTPHLKLFGGK